MDKTPSRDLTDAKSGVASSSCLIVPVTECTREILLLDLDMRILAIGEKIQELMLERAALKIQRMRLARDQG